MTGRGLDQILAHPSMPHLGESRVSSALEYVHLAEHVHGAWPRPVEADYVWGDALAWLDRERPHARLINLETSVTTSEDMAPKGINYRMHPGNVAVLTAAHIDCCGLANNHVLDWGVAGLVETLDTLHGAGLRTAGAGLTIRDAEAPAIIEVAGGARVLVFAFGAVDSGIPASWQAGADTPGINVLPDFSRATAARVARLVESWKRRGDVAVASIHWGGNWGYDILPSHRRFARALVDDAAIDVVCGHSSHHPRAIEVYRERPILYGCGDFLNDYEGIPGHEVFRADLVLMYFVSLDARDGTLQRLEMAPLQIRRFRLRRAADADRAWLRSVLDRECARFGHRVVERADRLALEWNG